MGFSAFTQTFSQWLPNETQNTNSSVCKPHPSLQWVCPCSPAAVMQHHDSDGPVHSLCKQRCAGRTAGGESSCCLWSLPLVSLGFDAAHAAALLKCPLAPQYWVRSIVLRLSTCPKCSQPGSWQLCARAFYMMPQMSPLSPNQTFRLLWI